MSVDPRGFAEVRRLAIGALARRAVTVHPGPGDAPGDDCLIGSDGMEYRLYSLQRHCAQLAAQDWAAAVETYFAEGIEALNAPPANALPPEELLAQIRTRLNQPLPPEKLSMAYARPAFDGLVVGLNRDLPTAVQTISDYDVAGYDLDLLYEEGQRNTDAEPMDIERLDHDVVGLMGESLFIASKALNMPGLIEKVFGGSAPLGVIFSVPHRSLMFLHAVGPKVMGALQWIVPVTIGQADEGPGGPISADTFYWCDGEVQRITRRDLEANTIEILIDGAFSEAINRVAAADQS